MDEGGVRVRAERGGGRGVELCEGALDALVHGAVVVGDVVHALGLHERVDGHFLPRA